VVLRSNARIVGRRRRHPTSKRDGAPITTRKVVGRVRAGKLTEQPGCNPGRARAVYVDVSQRQAFPEPAREVDTDVGVR
jgi:hypothetical protein